MGDPSLIDIGHQFKREEFSFNGNFRAIVENNVDEEQKAGRVQVRIFGLHSPLSEETPVSHLPWASPCLRYGWSGGHNIKNKETPDTNTRYNPGNNTEKVPAKNVQQLEPKSGVFIDPVEDDCGTGGHFEVPRKGTIVWVFFENGDHTKCHYWSACTKKADWDEQGIKITSDINEKISTINDLREKFDPDKEVHTGSSPADSAGVQTFCSKPRMSIYPIDDIPNHNISSFTSQNGTTFIIVNEEGKERIYIANKGSISHINEYGHKKELVGPTKAGNSTIDSNDEKLVAGHSELHVLGDYDLFVGGNCFIQVNGNAQINAQKNVGIVSKTGDVDVVIEQGNCNVEVTQGNMNSHIGGDLQTKVDGNLNAKITGDSDISVQGDLSAQIVGSTSIESNRDLAIKTSGSMTLDASLDLNISCNSLKISSQTDVSITGPSGLNVSAGSSFKVDAGGFGGDIAMYAPVSNALHTGCYPGPGAGSPTPYVAVAQPATPFIPIVLAQFASSRKSESVASGTKPTEQEDNVDAPNNPDITSSPSE
jgi:hypothetical protein